MLIGIISFLRLRKGLSKFLSKLFRFEVKSPRFDEYLFRDPKPNTVRRPSRPSVVTPVPPSQVIFSLVLAGVDSENVSPVSKFHLARRSGQEGIVQTVQCHRSFQAKILL